MGPLKQECVKSKRNNQESFFFVRVTDCKQMFRKKFSFLINFFVLKNWKKIMLKRRYLVEENERTTSETFSPH